MHSRVTSHKTLPNLTAYFLSFQSQSLQKYTSCCLLSNHLTILEAAPVLASYR